MPELFSKSCRITLQQLFGRRTSATATIGSTDDFVNSWTYDDASRLGSTTRGDGTSDYTYDANGNRTNTGYTTGDDNRLTSDGVYNYEYDAEGNRTKRTEISSGDDISDTWNHRNQLTAVAFYTSTNVLTKEIVYQYDPFGRRPCSGLVRVASPARIHGPTMPR